MTVVEYNQCVASWAKDVYRYAYYLLRHREDTEDIVQYAYEILWREINSVNVEKAKAFLFTITYRKCIDEHRYRKRRCTEIETIHAENISYHDNNQYEWNEILQIAISNLDHQSRALILLKDLHGYKYEEIAAMTDLSTEQVRVYLHRARKKIKDKIGASLIRQ